MNAKVSVWSHTHTHVQWILLAVSRYLSFQCGYVVLKYPLYFYGLFVRLLSKVRISSTRPYAQMRQRPLSLYRRNIWAVPYRSFFSLAQLLVVWAGCSLREFCRWLRIMSHWCVDQDGYSSRRAPFFTACLDLQPVCIFLAHIMLRALLFLLHVASCLD